MRKINKIIIHCMATTEGRDYTVAQIHDWYVKGNGWLNIGYHFVIDRNWSEEDLLQHRTDGTDAFDTLYIGCEKFPFRDSFTISMSGVI